MNGVDIGDMPCSLPILLDEYHNVLDVAEGIFSGSNCNSASKDKKGVSKGSHLHWRLFSKSIAYIFLENVDL